MIETNRGFSLLGLLIVLALVGLIAWLVISRYADSGVDRLADMGAPLDETRRQRTLTDMQAIGRALALHRTDKGSYPESLPALEAGGYLVQVPPADAWGTAWAYATDAGGFELRSLGADGREGPAAPVPWTGGSYACDLIMENGQLTQAPAGR